jgi:hypothetical protein
MARELNQNRQGVRLETHPLEPLRPFNLIVVAAFVLGLGATLRGQSDAPSFVQPANVSAAPVAPFWATRGHWDFGAQLGFALENNIPHNISHISMLILQPRLGLIVRDFHGPRFPVRRFEVVSEGIFGNSLHPGGHLRGYALLFHLDGKNWGHEVPFLEFGSGLQRTTLATRAPELSGQTQFSPQAGLGIQHFFSPQRALVLEYRYMHMSNASITPPNHGFNASMLTIGFHWLRRPRAAAKKQ